MATMILALADLGTVMSLQELLERGGHLVTWNAESALGPEGQELNAELVVLDAESEGCAKGAAAWRDHDPPPALLMVGTSAAAQRRASQSQCHFVPNIAGPEEVKKAVAAALATRFSGRMSGPFARAVLQLGASRDPLADARAIVLGAREVDIELVQACLRWHATAYVMASKAGITKLRELRTLSFPEIATCKLLDGTRTVQHLVASGDGAAVGRLLWGLISASMATCSVDPPNEDSPGRMQLSMTRKHLLARRRRLREASYYDILEVTRDANTHMIDYAARTTAARYAPDRLAHFDLGNLSPLAQPLWKQVMNARNTLMDVKARARYNETIDSLQASRHSPWAFETHDPIAAKEFFIRGQAALVAGESSKAVSDMAGACRHHPEHPTYEAYLCWARFRAGTDRDQDRAQLAHQERQTAESFLLGRRPWPEALVALALLCAADGDAGSARYHLLEALSIDPNLPVAQQLLGRLKL